MPYGMPGTMMPTQLQYPAYYDPYQAYQPMFRAGRFPGRGPYPFPGRGFPAYGGRGYGPPLERPPPPGTPGVSSGYQVLVPFPLPLPLLMLSSYGTGFPDQVTSPLEIIHHKKEACWGTRWQIAYKSLCFGRICCKREKYEATEPVRSTREDCTSPFPFTHAFKLWYYLKSGKVSVHENCSL